MTIRGKDCVFWVRANGELKPICCARSASITTTADIAETSTLGSGKWKTFKGMKLSFTLNAAGLVSFDMNYSIVTMRRKQIELMPLEFAFIGEDGNGLIEQYSGRFIITNINTPFTYNANFEYSLDGQGTGELLIITGPVNIENAIMANNDNYVNAGNGEVLLYN